MGLSSNNTSITVPANVTVAAGATTGAFTATVASVSSAQTATLPAKLGRWIQNLRAERYTAGDCERRELQPVQRGITQHVGMHGHAKRRCSNRRSQRGPV